MSPSDIAQCPWAGSIGERLCMTRVSRLFRTQMSGSGQNFTFQPLDERRHLSVEADQSLTSQACQEQAESPMVSMGRLTWIEQRRAGPKAAKPLGAKWLAA